MATASQVDPTYQQYLTGLTSPNLPAGGFTGGPNFTYGGFGGGTGNAPQPIPPPPSSSTTPQTTPQVPTTSQPVQSQVMQAQPVQQAQPVPSTVNTTTKPINPNMPQVAGIPNDPNSAALYGNYLGVLQGAQAPVDANDPIIKAQTDAYNAQVERANRSYLAQAAEQGGTNFNPDAKARALAEAGGQATGAYQAQLMSDERNARRNQIQSLLSTGTSFLTSQQAQQLQEELAQLNLEENAYQFDTQQQYLNSPLATSGV